MNVYEERLNRIQNQLEQNEIDLLAVTTAPNLRYFVGFVPHLDERFNALLISAQGLIWVAAELNREQIEAHVQVPLISWQDDVGPEHAIKSALQKVGIHRNIAIDGAGRADFLLRLQEVARPQKSFSADGWIASLRQIKASEEIEQLADAAAQADRAMQAGMQACRPGVTEQEVAWEIESFFRRDGAEMVDFTLVAAGPNGAFPHHHPSDRLLEAGEGVILDIGATLNGYKSDITRMVYLGEPSAEFLQNYEAVHQANLAARRRVQANTPVQTVDKAARNYLGDQELAEYFVHRTGHGIGLDIHEPPWIMDGNQTPLQEGMVFSIEPGVYKVGHYGIRIEDIVVVTDVGARVLTGLPHDLVIKPV